MKINNMLLRFHRVLYDDFRDFELEGNKDLPDLVAYLELIYPNPKDNRKYYPHDTAEVAFLIEKVKSLENELNFYKNRDFLL